MVNGTEKIGIFLLVFGSTIRPNWLWCGCSFTVTTTPVSTPKSNRRRGPVLDTTLKVEGLRSRRGKTSIESAMELKAKRETLLVRNGNYSYKTNEFSKFFQLIWAEIMTMRKMITYQWIFKGCLRNFVLNTYLVLGERYGLWALSNNMNHELFWTNYSVTLQEAKEMRRSKSTTPGVSPVQSEASDSNSQFTPGQTFFRQDPDFIVVKQESSDSMDTSHNLSANRSFFSIASSGSTSIRSLSESFKEVDEDSQFSYASSTRTDSWLTEQELKPDGRIGSKRIFHFVFSENLFEVFLIFLKFWDGKVYPFKPFP